MAMTLNQIKLEVAQRLGVPFFQVDVAAVAGRTESASDRVTIKVFTNRVDAPWMDK